MSATAVAQEFTAMLQAGDHHGAAAKFNDPKIVSIEAMDGPMARLEGTAALKAKSDWWETNHEVHSLTSTGPFLNGDQFAVVFEIDVTAKESGKRIQMSEIGLYTVAGGKIVEERFY